MIEPDVHRGFVAPDVPPSEVFDRCVRCGLCLPTCPTYVETLVETSGPRGRIALIKAVAEERLDLTSPGFVHQMSECLDCRACEAVCPSGVEYGRILEPARTQVTRALAPARSWYARLGRALLIGTMFEHLGVMRAAARLLKFYQRSGLRALVLRSGVLRALGLQDVEALAPRVSDRFFIPRDQRFSAPGTSRATALLHAGCVMHVAFAAWNEATVRVLNAAGVTVVVPSAQGCCGAITIHAGEMERGRGLAMRNIAAFEQSGADVYVINAAGCGSALKEYANLFHDDPAWAERARAFSAKVRDVTEYLDEIGIAPEKFGPVPGVVTYQDACHLAHAQRITAPPRRLLALVPGLELRAMPESSLCCGSAGIYNVTQPEMSQRLQRRKVDRIIETAPQTVATANPGCALQMRNGLDRAGASHIAIKHVVEILDESLRAGAAG
ncbi:glycolate oxidase iron-sulfur subunit [Vulcanimicrobium alpinum]|uniref:Glycolate oxidase iron-sulfur subunit n=1 Tax=Vulcanimicrobium alpinum TaxID=3016050 RepID=A0AAN1XW02_UNVUL|nr:heterodisulfide reductase-related iron-sulfur binding cluster [Vulcanimicrobium alpinum]BDE06453.1 glycolate oxidase iron-sulfur subunit [Vulcanimicrobium alpinum]